MRNLSILAASTALAMPRAFANDGAAKRVEPALTGAASIKLEPRQSKRGSVSLYPFDSLTAAGMAFGVKNKTASQLSSIISNQNRKHVQPVQDAAGNVEYETKEIKGADGAVTNVPDTTKPKTTATRHFYAVDVDDAIKAQIKGTALEGAKTLVYRDI